MSSKDTFDVYSRLFNHRPFLQGEARHFVKEFEEKRQDSEVDNIFKTLETVTELRDYEIDKLKALCDTNLPSLNENLLVASSLCNKILDQTRSTEIEQALLSSRQVRDQEWTTFLAEIQSKSDQVDDIFKQKEKELIANYAKLEQAFKDD